MSDDFPNSVVELVVFAIPAAMLLLLVVLLVRGIARRRTPDPRIAIKNERVGIANFNARQSPNAPGAEQPAGDAGQPMTLLQSDTSSAGVSPAAEPETRTELRAEARAELRPEMPAVDEQPAALPAAIAPLARLQDADQAIEAVTDQEPTAALAALHLERAEILAELNRNDERKAALLSVIGISQLIGDHKASAKARLALAKLAQQAGDMTTACEHWQLARVALKESGQNDEHDRVDQLMRDNGCPTDWVLNDF